MVGTKRIAKFFKLLRLTRLPFMPFILGIETGNICNLKCPLCPTGVEDLSMKKGFMRLEVFKKVFDEVKDSIQAINLYSWGEPLLNPDLINIINYAKKNKTNVKIITSTNLNIRNDHLLSEFIKSGIDEVIISCDGVTAQTYVKYRKGGDFDLVMRNMKFLLAENKRLGMAVRLIWNFIVFKHNEHEVEDAKQLAAELGIELRIGKMRTSMKDEILGAHGKSIEKDIDWIPDNPEYSAYNKEKMITKKIIKTCRKPWQEISVNWDGSIFPCCAIYGDKYAYGNLSEGGIKDNWNNKLYIEARKEIIDKKIKALTICGICRNHGFLHM